MLGDFSDVQGRALAPCVEGLEEELALAVELPEGIVGDLEEVAVEVLEVAAVAAPEDLLGGLDDACSEALGLLQDGVDLLGRGRIIADRKSSEVARLVAERRISLQCLERIEA